MLYFPKHFIFFLFGSKVTLILLEKPGSHYIVSQGKSIILWVLAID